MSEGVVKAAKGLIRAEVKVKNGKIEKVKISGDFFLYPPEALWDLEKELVGVRLDPFELRRIVEKFFTERKIVTPLVSIEDFVKALLRGAGVEKD